MVMPKVLPSREKGKSTMKVRAVKCAGTYIPMHVHPHTDRDEETSHLQAYVWCVQWKWAFDLRIKPDSSLSYLYVKYVSDAARMALLASSTGLRDGASTTLKHAQVPRGLPTLRSSSLLSLTALASSSWTRVTLPTRPVLCVF